MATRIRSIAVVFALLAALLGGLIAPAIAPAGTTGGLRGRVIDAATNAPLAGVVVTATSPSQSASTRTSAAGEFNFLSLSPDTYVVSAQLQGFDGASAAGVSVFADQVQTVGTFSLAKTIRTIGTVRARSSSSLVRAGTTSDVYSVNAAGAAAAAAVGGPGGLNQAYSAIATVPGANVPQGQQGWNQLVYIRGGDYSDVSNELDGIPVQRDSDYAPITTLSSLGQQEVQTYTGGTPPSAEASGLSGYINQVIKTGTYPGYETVSLGIGSPTFYHKLSVEASGATTNRNFTYYVGLGGENQDYRYSDQFNGAGVPLFFYPLYVSTGLNGQVYDGSGPAYFSDGQNYAIAHTSERDSIGNFHFYIPHKDGQLKDDIQLLYVTSDIQSAFYSSVQDLGGASFVGNSPIGPPYFTDQYVYDGTIYAPPNANAVAVALSPSSPTHVPFDGLIPLQARDADDHNASILKLQYQKNFSASQYLRLYGYSEYTDWFLNGPVSAYLPYGGELQDYEVHGNAFGVTAQYVNQINAQNLLTLTGSYNTQKLETYSGNNYQGSITTNLVDKKGNCYSPFTGLFASCYTPLYNADGSINPSGGLNQYGFFGAVAPGFSSSSLAMPATPPAGSPAATNGAQNLVT
ncbi:MAG: TonB-dependent receptor, partial [Candidatus Eremiobacteraeota bacterium]|nr:TonB-dependent receptor [Candidatus Eremiobacteraeota bacterium]